MMWLFRLFAPFVVAVVTPVTALAQSSTATTPPVSLERQINEALDRGIHRLRSLQRPDGSFRGLDRAPHGHYPMGYTALVTYALVKSGVRADDPAVKSAFEYLAGLPFLKTYSVSVYALALDASDDPSCPDRLSKIATWLEQNLDDLTNLWGYPDGGPELSNTQFAALALAAAERHGHRTPTKIWSRLIDGALRRQSDRGGFYYRSGVMPEDSGTMTTAGITTLYIAREALAREGRDKGSQREAAAGIQRGLAWLDARFSTTGNPIGPDGVLRDRYPAYGNYFYHYYFLYGIERVASLLDRDAFGGLPWYRQGAHEVLAHESPEGGWGSGEGTCFAILFLRRATLSGSSSRSVVADDADLAGADSETEAKTARAALRDSWGVPLIAAASAGDEALAHWAYTTDEPPRSWNKRDFDDDDWARGLSGFGTAGASGLTVRTLWQGSPDLWVRRSFHWNPGDGELGLHVMHDDSVEVFINGKLAAEGALWSQGRYASYGLSKEARKALRQGENVVAAHVHDIGGGRSLDVRFTQPEDVSHYSDQWIQSRPWPDVAFVRRWQIAGPVNNPEHTALLDRESPEQVNDNGERSVAGKSWREHRVLGEQLDLGDVLSARENTLCWAATGLTVDEREKCYLWLAASGGLRAWLDGVPLMLNHEHVAARAKDLRVPVTLTAGFHRLVFAVEQQSEPAVLRAQLARVTGAPVESLRYSLGLPEPDDEESARVATAQPDQFSLGELAELLPESSSRALEFGRAEHLQSVGVWSTGPTSPRWIDRPQAKDPGPSPPSGARGMLLLRPRGEYRPARLVARSIVPPDAVGFSVRVAAPTSVGAGARVRLGVFEGGAVSWIADQVVRHGERGGRGSWVEVQGDFGQPPASPALLLVLVERQEGCDPPVLFLESIDVR